MDDLRDLRQVQPELLIECGANVGGAALFYGKLFDQMGHGRVITVDVVKLHNLSHPRIEFLVSSSVEAGVVEQMTQAARAASGPVMVILDSDQSTARVRKELELASGLVTPDSYLLVHDGSIDTSPYFPAAAASAHPTTATPTTPVP